MGYLLSILSTLKDYSSKVTVKLPFQVSAVIGRWLSWPAAFVCRVSESREKGSWFYL